MSFETIKTVLPEKTTSTIDNPFDSNDTKTLITSFSSISKEPTLIFSKIATANAGYYYSTEPTIDLVSEDPSRYFIEIRDKVFTNNKYLSSVTFDVYFVFTNQDVRASDGDSFNILSTVKTIPVKSTQFLNNVTIIGGPVPSIGGTRTIQVQGDPGSTVNLVLQGDDGNYYNWTNSSWSSIISTKKIRIPTMEDFPGYLPQDVFLGFYYEEVFFPRVAAKVKHTVTATPTNTTQLKVAKELDIITPFQVTTEDTQLLPVYLTIKGTTDDVYTFNEPLIVGPFTPNQPCDVEILDINSSQYTLVLSETSAGAGDRAFLQATAPVYPTHWSNATEDTLSGWEFNIIATVVASTETNVKIVLGGTVLKAGSVSLTTVLDLSADGLGAGLVPIDE